MKKLFKFWRAFCDFILQKKLIFVHCLAWVLPLGFGCGKSVVSSVSEGSVDPSIVNDTQYSLSKSRVPSRTDLEELEKKLAELKNKREIKVVVTDSGIGGMSVMAKDLGKMYNVGLYQKANFIFANAIFSQNVGFSSLSDQALANIFSRSLYAMAEKFRPDVIVIACNTLSVIYPLTEFSKHTKLPIVDIVDTSIKLISANKAPQSDLIYMFGTPVTIRSKVYKNELVSLGHDENSIIDEACSGLVSAIETNVGSAETARKIDDCVGAAVKRRDPYALKGNVYVSLNCTHFPFALEAWKEAFERRGISVKKFLNPNAEMTEFFYKDKSILQRFSKTTTSARVYSMIPFRSGVATHIANIIEKNWSGKAAAALRKPEIDPNFFKWQDLTN